MEHFTEVKNLFKNPDEFLSKEIAVSGWVKSIRTSRKVGFLILHDGTCFKTLQIVFEEGLSNFDEISKLNVGSSVVVRGTLISTPDARQPFEVQASNIEVEGRSTPDYPLQKKRHTMEFLRTIPHLRSRTNTFMAVFRVRSILAYAIHRFYQENGFVYIHTPLITSSDCEGAGEMFQVTTLDLDLVAKSGKPPAYNRDFFGKPAFLTVSGQLDVETFLASFRNVYTFGPAFRAENSNTPRHAAEFWMIEPELAFADLDDLIEHEETMFKYIINYVLENAPDEMQFFDSFVEKGLIAKLKGIVSSDFGRVTYSEAIDILLKNGDIFENKVAWGMDLQTEHERFLTEKIFKKPLFVTDYPRDIKAFYMKQNPDGKTVAAVDLLVPGVGEIMGGSQREEDYDKLIGRMSELDLDLKSYGFYLDLRKYGTIRHAGFGLGFERALMYITGMANIRDCIPFPRTPGNCEQ